MIAFILITGIGAFLVKRFMNAGRLKNILFWTLVVLASIIPAICVGGFIIGFVIGIVNRIM
jgi:hypothetical protein